jgi:hypothetical protein
MANFSNVSEPENWNDRPHAFNFSDEFYFFSNDSNNWNYNRERETDFREFFCLPGVADR